MDSMLDSSFYIDGNGKNNIYEEMLNEIMGKASPAIQKILDRSMKFKSKKIELNELICILKEATKACVNKLYHSECRGFSLREILDRAEHVPHLYSVAVDNITFAVMNSISPTILGSMFYYWNQDFIFFYIRDSIVEPNYREYIKSVREVYEKPSHQDQMATTMKAFKEALVSLSENLLVDASDRTTVAISQDLDNIRKLIEDVDPNSAEMIAETDILYPLPKFILDIICKKGNVNTEIMSEFITKLKTTFTLVGLRELFKMHGGVKAHGYLFENKLKKLYEDRCLSNNTSNAIDGLTASENQILLKMVSFKPLSDSENSIIKKNTILNRIRECLEGFPSVDTNILYDNDKIVVRYKSRSKTMYYYSDTVVSDKDNPFLLFNITPHKMIDIQNNEPEKFCTNQAIITKEENRRMVVEGRKEPKSLSEKRRHNKNLLESLLRIKNINKDNKLMSEVVKLRNGDIEQIKYVKTNWFNNVIINDIRECVLVLSEMEGLNKLIRQFMEKNSVKPS